MPVDDRDPYRDAQPRREAQRPPGAPLPASLRFGHLGIIAFWLVVMGIVWLALDHYMKPKPAIVTASGDLQIPRHRDGHFYVDGTVNGRPIRFLVDTGASMVFVSEAFARDAGLPQGLPTQFHTANGTIRGNTVRDVRVSAGPLAISATAVGVGLVGPDQEVGLLGQGFLSRFDMSVTRKELVLRRRGLNPP